MSRPLGFCAVPNAPSDDLARREHSEPEHAYRAPFERDRARVIHARAFRRLAGKTQVFSASGAAGDPSDHFRSRLTHTMEVAQIARTAATTLGLNHDLVETLALVHDIGHPPFGHAGERALDTALREHGLRFDHNLHALRIVEHFEQRYAAFRGLNLTFAVREGIIKHSRDYSQAEHPELAGYLLGQRPPLESQLIDLADEIAYLTADLDDGMESGLLDLEQVRANLPLFDRFYTAMADQHPAAAPRLVFNEALKRTLNALVGDLLDETVRRVRAAGVQTLADVRNAPERLVSFSVSVEEERRMARKYLYTHLYGSEALELDHAMAERIVRELFAAWVAEPSLLPAAYAGRVQQGNESAPRVVADYIAGMTDGFLMQQHRAWLAHIA